MRSPVLLERLATREDQSLPADPAVVASLPGGGTWPLSEIRFGQWVGRRRIRRFAAAVLVTAGVLDIVSAFVRRLRDLGVIDRALPFTVHPVAGVGAVLTGCALIGVARGVRLGRRRAWLAAIVLLLVAAAAHLLKGNHVEEAIAGLAIAGWLALERRHFRVRPPGRGRALAAGVMLALFAVVLATGLGVAVGGETSDARPAIALAVGGVAVLAALVGRFRGPQPNAPEDRDLAASIVARHAAGPFDHRALADGNRWLFSGETVIAHSVHDDLMTVAPDPVGPPAEHASAWADAMDHADTYGWSIAVDDASATWLPTYRAAGLTDTFVGDDLLISTSVLAATGTEFVTDTAERRAAVGDATLRLETTATDESLDLVASDASGRVALEHRYARIGSDWLLVRARSETTPEPGLADVLVLEALRQIAPGGRLALGPAGHGVPSPDLRTWAGVPGVEAVARYAVADSAGTGPGRGRRW